MRYLNFTTSPLILHGDHQAPVECLIIALDGSPSMEEKDWPPSRFAAAQEAASALIKRKLTLASNDQVGIVAYADSGNVIANPMRLADGHQKLISLFSKIKIGSGTDIGAGLQTAGRLLFQNGMQRFFRRLLARHEIESPVIRRIVLLSDGHHNGSRNPRRIAKSLKRYGVIIDCVGIGGTPSDVDEPLLKAVASTDPKSGGPRYAFIGDKNQLIERFQHLAGRITR